MSDIENIKLALLHVIAAQHQLRLTLDTQLEELKQECIDAGEYNETRQKEYARSIATLNKQEEYLNKAVDLLEGKNE